MHNKELKKRRMMSYFIESTINLMKNEKMENITIRRIADVAGYNSATLYNYFNNLEHLIMYASVSRLKGYITDLQKYMNCAENALEEYFGIWECFCDHAFALPDIYYRIFFGEHSDITQDVIKSYYAVFPEELEGVLPSLVSMLTEENIFERNKSILQRCAAEGIILEERIESLNELTLYFFKGVLSELVENNMSWTADKRVERTMSYIREIFSYYCLEKWKNTCAKE